MADREYTTISGDTFDLVAWKMYGRESLADKIMEANMDKLDYLIFPDNLKLKIPDPSKFISEAAASDTPEWRTSLNA